MMSSSYDQSKNVVAEEYKNIWDSTNSESQPSI